jgi:hypothetical protein
MFGERFVYRSIKHSFQAFLTSTTVLRTCHKIRKALIMCLIVCESPLLKKTRYNLILLGNPAASTSLKMALFFSDVSTAALPLFPKLPAEIRMLRGLSAFSNIKSRQYMTWTLGVLHYNISTVAVSGLAIYPPSSPKTKRTIGDPHVSRPLGTKITHTRLMCGPSSPSPRVKPPLLAHLPPPDSHPKTPKNVRKPCHGKEESGGQKGIR